MAQTNSSAPKDYYTVLGVSRSVTPDELQRAYRKLARTWHPDVNAAPEAEDRFKEISEAYDVLSDADTRAKYDAFGAEFRRVPDGVDPAAWARAQRGQGSRQNARSAAGDVFVDFGDVGGAGPSIEDLFGDLFGQGGYVRQGEARAAAPRAGPDQQVEIELSVRDAYRGGERKISLTGGGGPKNYTVKIPAGVTDGQRIRLAGQGSPGRGGGPPGDLYLIIRLGADQRFRVDGRTISVDLAVTPSEAALGATVAVDTPDGGTKIKVPPGTSSGQRLRLRGLGMPNAAGSPGDLYAVVQIMVPKQLTEEERELFTQLAAASSFDPRRTP